MNERRASRLGIYIPFALFAVFAIAYTVVWNRGASALEVELTRFAEREAQAGRTLSYGEVSTAGFPFTLRGTIEDVRWTSPGLGAFEADTVTVVSLPYNPTKIRLIPTGEQVLTIGEDAYDLEADDLRFALERSFGAVEGHGITLTGEERTITAKDLIANRQQLAGDAAIALMLRELIVEDENRTILPFLDIAAARQNNAITLSAFQLTLTTEDAVTPTQIAGDGQLTADDAGVLSGELALRLKSEGALIDILGRVGAIDQETTDTVKAAVGLMTAAGTKEVSLPLTVEDGVVTLGFIPLGTLPPLED